MSLKWQEPNCPICGTKDNLRDYYQNVTTWEFKGRFRMVKCQQCGLLIQSPRAPFENVARYYPSERYWGMNARAMKKPRDWKKKREKDFGYIYRELFKMKKTGRILDVGCGTGAFLTKFKQKHWEVTGTDIIKPMIAYARRVYGLKVLGGNIEDLKMRDKQFDVITINNVLEHIYHPEKALKKVARLLKDDGILMVAVPNSDSVGHRLYGKNWLQISPGKHLFIFNPRNVSLILEMTGFKVTAIKHNYFVHNYYCLYNSARMMLSPKFRKERDGGIVGGDINQALTRSKFSLTKEVGKVVIAALACVAALLEAMIGKSEIMVVYAKKKYVSINEGSIN